jgi:thiosulfate/3-mercaptopyruvate sulfurtransferase
MPTTLPSPLVSALWLAAHHAQVKIVDASWHMPAAQRDAQAEFHTAHIPQAVFFDLDAHSAPTHDLPHMLPDATQFSAAIGALGISNSDAIVVYDSAGLFSAARLWWMLRVFGHTNVAVLDGGLPSWRRAGQPLASGEAHPAAAVFSAHLNPCLLRDKLALQKNLSSAEAVVLDARSPDRFSGAEAEPRAGLRSGHIPASRNVHFRSLLKDDGTFKPGAELADLLACTTEKPVISTCGSGVTACILDLALELIGHRHHAVYDGSWAEWGADPSCPLETGASS